MLITRDNLVSFESWEYMKSLFSPDYELKSVFEYDKVSRTVKLKSPYGSKPPEISHTYYSTNIREPLYTPPSRTSFLDSVIYRVFLQNREFKEHRNAWLNFKDFVCKYSELEDKSLQYYELWGEFYYYALAVGAIKNPLLG
ncbi:MAG: hypothetical protein QW400_00020 [Candidatus Diapherotrites archaeon]